jgi:hypothetical protein
MRTTKDTHVHRIGWASQPDLQFICDESWSTPKWGSPDEQKTDVPGVHVADDDRLYTFDPKKVTCPLCKGKTDGA